MPNFNGLWTSRQQLQARGVNTWPARPGAPTSPVATAGNMSASVAFTAPADTGFPPNAIIGYRVTSSPGGFTGTGLTSPVTVSGLTNGTAYTFTVAAQNVNGYGPESVASNSVTPVLPNYVEDVFSTFLYTGNGSTQTITNGIDLAGKGGLTWIKRRDGVGNHNLFDTARGATKKLYSDLTNAEFTDAFSLTSFNSNGFSVGVDVNGTDRTYASWTFREQPKFFDVVTYTGSGAGTQTINHSLGSTPGFIVVKRLNATSDWWVYHRSLSFGDSLRLNLTNAVAAVYEFGTVNSTSFEVVANALCASGGTYVAYIFAHNAGGFGNSGNDNVITCGSFTTDSSGNATVNLGYEPQWLLSKTTNVANSWDIVDVMRSWPVGPTNDAFLYPNNSNAEFSSATKGEPTATGFNITAGGNTLTYIYIAIRRGPMATPTTGTSVFMPYQVPASPTTGAITGFVTDAGFIRQRSATEAASWGARLMGNPTLNSTSNNPQQANTNQIWDRMNGWWNSAINNYMTWGFARAPGFMDVVCYTGTGVARTVNHNLTVAPELIIVKDRTTASAQNKNWMVYSSSEGISKTAILNSNDQFFNPGVAMWGASNPTASVFGLGAGFDVNDSGATYVSYLFASCPGVSKVGSFTGTGATQLINCGFAAGARFVLIKAASTTGGWLYWDSVRGIVASNDPYLVMNTTAAEVTNTDWVDTATTGFELSNAAGNLANSNGVTYIYLAIA